MQIKDHNHQPLRLRTHQWQIRSKYREIVESILNFSTLRALYRVLIEAVTLRNDKKRFPFSDDFFLAL